MRFCHLKTGRGSDCRPKKCNKKDDTVGRHIVVSGKCVALRRIFHAVGTYHTCMEQYGRSKQEVLELTKSGEGGLTSAEAEKRLAQNGRNVLQEGKKRSKLLLFLAQFADLMTIILILAAALSAVLAFVTGDRTELADTGILLFVILLNAVVGFLQQYRADAAIEKLKKLSACEAKAVRDGKVVKLDAETLVVGDVIELEEGDRIPADCRILHAENFRCDESSLTGESRPAKKYDCVVTRSALAVRANTAHFGTFCVKGRARCVVTACGMDTEMGKIARLLHKSKPAPAPLDKTVAKLGKVITVTVLCVALVLFTGSLIAGRVSFLESVMSAVAVAVAAIPEGMGAVVTVILALGVQRMASSRAVMRRLGAVESLGGCSVICSDKTGTLTENRMTVEAICTDFAAPMSAEERYTGTMSERELLRCMRICHTVKGGAGAYVGDPTEVALVEYADRIGFSCDFEQLGGVPFSSERKMMSVFARTQEGRRLYVKGGADVLLAKCTRILTDAGERTITEADRAKVRARVSAYAGRAMRVLGFACGDSEREEGLVFVGLAAMLDPPKQGVKEAVAACRRAGVRTVMITGDAPETALAIAARLGIAKHLSQVVTGEELDAMGEEELSRRAAKYAVYARVSPGHKQQIVRALQRAGEVVAMTGDGVNDAPALKSADVGVAMGSGTDVTKNAADVVLTDDDFSTMVRAVEEGRNVFFNIKKTISFFLSTNFAEVLSVFIVTLFLWRYDFLTSTQLLWVNLITDSLPVLALGMERTEGAMDRPPVSDKEIFSPRAICSMLFFGVMLASVVIALFCAFLHFYGNGVATTAAFLTLSLSELLHVFNVRAEGTRKKLRDWFSNRALLVTVAVGVVLNVMLVLSPALCTAFRLTPLTGVQWLWVALCSLFVFPLGAGYRVLMRRLSRMRLNRRRTYIPVRGNG